MLEFDDKKGNAFVHDLWFNLSDEAKKRVLDNYFSWVDQYDGYLYEVLRDNGVHAKYDELKKIVRDIKRLKVGWYKGEVKINGMRVPIKFKPIFAWVVYDSDIVQLDVVKVRVKIDVSREFEVEMTK